MDGNGFTVGEDERQDLRNFTRRRWRDSVRSLGLARELTMEQAQILAMDRSGWRRCWIDSSDAQ